MKCIDGCVRLRRWRWDRTRDRIIRKPFKITPILSTYIEGVIVELERVARRGQTLRSDRVSDVSVLRYDVTTQWHDDVTVQHSKSTIQSHQQSVPNKRMSIANNLQKTRHKDVCDSMTRLFANIHDDDDLADLLFECSKLCMPKIWYSLHT